MALLLAMMRTLVDEKLEAGGSDHPAERAGLPARAGQPLHHAVLRACFEPLTGELTYVNAGHMPPLLSARDGTCERLTGRRHRARDVRALDVRRRARRAPARRPAGGLQRRHHRGREPDRRPFDELGLETALQGAPAATASPQSAPPSCAPSSATRTTRDSPTTSRFCCSARTRRRRSVSNDGDRGKMRSSMITSQRLAAALAGADRVSWRSAPSRARARASRAQRR